MKYDLHFVYVCKAHGDCSGHGLSSRVDSAYLFWDCTKEEALEWCKENHKDPEQQFILVKRELWGEDHSYAEPLIKPEGMAQVFGGNFLYTSSSNGCNISGKKCATPIPIHDRFETWEEFDALSV